MCFGTILLQDIEKGDRSSWQRFYLQGNEMQLLFFTLSFSMCDD